MMRFLRSKKAFTLVELMIVVAIIGILAGIAIPRYMNFVRRSREGATKGNLGTIRSALNIYYSDTDGIFPARQVAAATNNGTGIQAAPFIGMTANNYLDALPGATEDCQAYGTHKLNSTNVEAQNMAALSTQSNGGWVYQTLGTNLSTSACKVAVNCGQVDTKGTTISLW